MPLPSSVRTNSTCGRRSSVELSAAGRAPESEGATASITLNVQNPSRWFPAWSVALQVTVWEPKARSVTGW